ncbi:hypothetical protein AZH53_03020 [Methanomicrobiaceae archaeon CYW5]|uniref:type IV pilin N-terminal domain-containing protein n=1 Tax=Methanovulcanius yangii TaxID=1789227 RepID=UPI0029CA7EF3|nr:type IV pilin N-terminal domain-containing protein [Methanovulcanius yangii]MBT8507402.1 hypothetical protein [Methanovulcanius yangii]
MKSLNNEEATTPVIGVILMVAVTMILAAVIGVYVFGLPQDIDNTKIVAVSAKQVGDQIQVTYMGSSSSNKVVKINASTYNGGVYNDSEELVDPEKGQILPLLNGGTNNLDQVVVVATFDDGTSQVVYDEVV